MVLRASCSDMERAIQPRQPVHLLSDGMLPITIISDTFGHFSNMSSHWQNQKSIWAYEYGAFFVLHEDGMCGKQQIIKQTCHPGRKGLKWFHCSVSSVNVCGLWRSYLNAQKLCFLLEVHQISEQAVLRTECIAQSLLTSISSVLAYADSEIL